MRTLEQILGTKKKVSLVFNDLIVDETRDGLPILHLVMAKPLDVVYGRKIPDEMSGGTITLEARDVERVSIGAEALTAINIKEAEIQKAIENGDKDVKPLFTWTEEGKSGTLECDLQLDVSNAAEVWIVKEKFSAFGARKRKERRSNENSALINKIKDAKTKSEFKNVDVNAPEKPASVAGS